MNFGGNNSNSGANNAALAAAITALNNKGGVVYFPKGVYSFTSHVSLGRDSITFKGAGSDSTHLRFNMNGLLNNCFNVWGTNLNSDTSSFAAPGVRDSNSVNVFNSGAFQVGQWVYLQTLDNAYMYSAWAYGSLGQVMQIKAISGNKISFHSPFRFYYTLALKPKIKKINPLKVIGFECMKIQRLDATAQQTSLLSFDKAVQCWAHGIEGDSTNYSHVELNRCSNIEITNSYFHHAFSYGGSGQAYGITFQYSANECKAENNIFQNLRHSILFQAGANGNVCGYNYSFNPYWNEGIFPANSAGDIVFHGNYPFANLCEGNINQNSVIDNSHAKNGPYNTLFRNRSELWGLVMNNSPASDTVQFLGLEITNSTAPYGQYLLYGNGHLQHGNKVAGVLTPNNPAPLIENSLYLQGAQKPICFAPGLHNWPVIGIPNTYNSGTNAAKDRAMQNKWAVCDCPNLITGFQGTNNIKPVDIIFPNPITNEINIKSAEAILEACIYSISGQLLLNKQGKNVKQMDVSLLANGIYLLSIRDKNGIRNYKIIKE